MTSMTTETAEILESSDDTQEILQLVEAAKNSRIECLEQKYKAAMSPARLLFGGSHTSSYGILSADQRAADIFWLCWRAKQLARVAGVRVQNLAACLPVPLVQIPIARGTKAKPQWFPVIQRRGRDFSGIQRHLSSSPGLAVVAGVLVRIGDAMLIRRRTELLGRAMHDRVVGLDAGLGVEFGIERSMLPAWALDNSLLGQQTLDILAVDVVGTPECRFQVCDYIRLRGRDETSDTEILTWLSYLLNIVVTLL